MSWIFIPSDAGLSGLIQLTEAIYDVGLLIPLTQLLPDLFFGGLLVFK